MIYLFFFLVSYFHYILFTVENTGQDHATPSLAEKTSIRSHARPRPPCPRGDRETRRSRPSRPLRPSGAVDHPLPAPTSVPPYARTQAACQAALPSYSVRTHDYARRCAVLLLAAGGDDVVSAPMELLLTCCFLRAQSLLANAVSRTESSSSSSFSNSMLHNQ